MPDQPGAGRLDPEILAAYIDGLLPPEERARVEAEIAADPETYEWVVNSINAVDDPTIVQAEEPQRRGSLTPGPLPEPGPRPGRTDGTGTGARVLPFYRRRTVQLLVGSLFATAATAIVAIEFAQVPLRRTSVIRPDADSLDERLSERSGKLVGSSAVLESGFGTLVAAVGEHRLVEPRLTGGFKFGPMRRLTRGARDIAPDASEAATVVARVAAVSSEFRRAASETNSAEALHAWGVAQLLLGDSEGSITTLRAAMARAGEPSIQADLAAALIAYGRFRGDKKSFEEALTLVAGLKAPEAVYNRALALSALGRDEEAKGAWLDASLVDVGSGWDRDAAARAGQR